MTVKKFQHNTVVCEAKKCHFFSLVCFSDAESVSNMVKTYLIPHIFTKSLANLLFDVIVEVKNIDEKKLFLQILSKLLEFESVTYDFSKPKMLKDLMNSLYEKQKSKNYLSSFFKVCDLRILESMKIINIFFVNFRHLWILTFEYRKSLKIGFQNNVNFI